MGSIKREKRVLKLVHPGRHIEVHREPVTAQEVMRKNPRHCITRPDVFNFPWIVVKPESILLPGSVFLIVPNHTIYNLLKAKTTQSTESQSPSSQQNQLSPTNHVHQQFQQDYSHSQRSSNCLGKTIMSQNMENVCTLYDWDERSQNQSYVKETSYDYQKKDVNLEFVSSEQVITMLKSCLRTPDSMRKKLNLKVSFNLPIEKVGSDIHFF